MQLSTLKKKEKERKKTLFVLKVNIFKLIYVGHSYTQYTALKHTVPARADNNFASVLHSVSSVAITQMPLRGFGTLGKD